MKRIMGLVISLVIIGLILFGCTKPVIEQNQTKACTQDWQCGGWANCSLDGNQLRICSDGNNCSNATGKPPESQACIPKIENNTNTTNSSNSSNTSNTNASANASNTSSDYISNMQRGTVDPNLGVSVYNPDKAWNGLTLLSDIHDPQKTRLIEVNMLGEIVWEYVFPASLTNYRNPGLDVESLSNGNILFVAPLKGVYEINRNGTIVWSYLDSKVSHDADRLPNGNTLVAWGGVDSMNDAQVKEINPQGQIVWSWYAKDHFNTPQYKSISREGWTHTNAVTRLANGNTLISLRNFQLTVEVNPQGQAVWSFDWSKFGTNPDPHDPELLDNDNLLACLPSPAATYQAVEINRTNGETAWHYLNSSLISSRDCDRLPNGNTLIVTMVSSKHESTILEVTSDGEIVWQLNLNNAPAIASPGWFYTAERIAG